ncbi:MAG TPA: FecR domain-containing protein [Dinghuibacter sp.]|uniref:FecR family protein n=1 Tax=Dinghuibacter sp. TaxID=2024697 RepID=UPI002D152A8B|nr:FecR domain-containing protein [Dinghuibacter sp.]HTJ11763.1 FecR domain-containing protein [Dinghuibacter sp.]
MDLAYFNSLIEKYLTDSIQPSEEQELLDALEQTAYRAEFERIMDELAREGAFSDAPDPLAREAGYEKWMGAVSARELRPLRHLPRLISVAAAVLLIAGAGVYFRLHSLRKAVVSAPAPSVAAAPVTPGGNRAVLRLAGGRTILLDSAHDGLLATQGATRIVKQDSGELRYQAAPASDAVVSNTISTPRGGQYQLVLPDGTRVWLDASSSLTFPTGFRGNERIVDMTGEAYFEVAPNARQSFKVRVDGVTVEVLGTHFNIMAYGDERAVKTTLIQGSVKVTKDAFSQVLRPGEQAVLDREGAAPSVQTADVGQAVAWKNGYFEFENMDLKTIMRQISRWYDVDIRIEGQEQQARFGGGISRKLELTQVLRLLETNGVRFRLDNRTLIVNPQS